MTDDKISMGDEATHRRALDLFRQLVTVFTLENGDELIGQVTGDVLAAIREDRELCAAFLYLVGRSGRAWVEIIAYGYGMTPSEYLAGAFTFDPGAP